ncbi:Glycosyl hydrolase family 26 [Actinacidiphila cocklensis]|uniref:Glycosyl hydrolase family 26 n=1 Tax=Actinacidiphila cocklensis TaxID=887465 RepID=A0A9W4GSW9_9ACTN|nr:Glycosyl hydrolase family 26 [Actinacidiphila cocklensis]
MPTFPRRVSCSHPPARPWRVLVGLLVSLLTVTLAACSSSGGDPFHESAATGTPSSRETPVPAPKGLTKADYLHPKGQYYGVATFHAPARATTDSATVAAGVHPRILEYYQSWNKPFSLGDFDLSYQQGALPLLTWEPYGTSRAADQPQYALKKIASGSFDRYIITFARQVKAAGRPILLRFAHEMNGDWYPWSEQNSGNAPGDYVKAWRHVHDLFDAVGSTQVIWVWSPNILRGTNGVQLQPLYPGDQYVDWIGIDGYGTGEKSARDVLQPTVDAVESFSGKPILLAETGSSTGPQQAEWTADLFRWLKSTPNVIGFVWFQHSQDEGGRYDYRFDIDPQNKAAYRQGLNALSLVPWPATDAKIHPNG